MWEACALDEACICPIGSHRGNHRQDQAALTLVLAIFGLRCLDSWVLHRPIPSPFAYRAAREHPPHGPTPTPEMV